MSSCVVTQPPFGIGWPDTTIERPSVSSSIRVHGVVVGAHPGYADRENFGRKDLDLRNQDIASLVVYQLGALAALADSIKTVVRYIKPHGALYTQACRDRRIASLIGVTAIQYGLPLVGLPGSQLEAVAQGRVPYIPEGFADRRYLSAREAGGD